MKLVIITKRYDSTTVKQKVQPTPLDAEGKPMYAIYLSDERAQALIDAGVAELYTDSNDDAVVVEDPNADVVTDNNEGNADTNSNDDVTDEEESNDDEASETKSKSSAKKSKASK